MHVKLAPTPLSPYGDVRRTFYNRTFSKLGKGSLRGSIFALCASAIGSGVLSLPYVLGLCGWALGASFMLLGAIAAEISLRMLAHLAVHHGLPNYSKIVITNIKQMLLKRVGILPLDSFFDLKCREYFLCCCNCLVDICIGMRCRHEACFIASWRKVHTIM